ncbi:DUF1566 domain-containing protein [Candidatus Competibacter phosphatis]|nr:DUF1566 domain-containing protein [Candidatus Competibacter phosphatis]
MQSRWPWIGLGIVLGLMVLPVWGTDPDPEAVRRLMEKYRRETTKKSPPTSKPVTKPAPEPAPKKPARKSAPKKSAVNYDREAWKSAEKCGTAACFEAYLADYPKGRYARMARARLKSVSAPRTPEPKTPVGALAVPPRPTQTLLADRYQDNGDGTVTDVRTGLQWMRCSLGQTWQGGTCVGWAEEYTWQEALDTAATLNRQGGYASYSDWRVPTKKELLTLIYCSSGQPNIWNDTGQACQGGYERPTIYQPVFPNTPDSRYWSLGKTSYYTPWIVSFGSGFAGAGKEINLDYPEANKSAAVGIAKFKNKFHVRLVSSKR